MATAHICLALTLLQHNTIHTRLHQRVHGGDFAFEEAETFGDFERYGAGREGLES